MKWYIRLNDSGDPIGAGDLEASPVHGSAIELPVCLRELYCGGVYLVVHAGGTAQDPGQRYEIRYDERKGRLFFRHCADTKHDLVVERVVRLWPYAGWTAESAHEPLRFTVLSPQGVARYVAVWVSRHRERASGRSMGLKPAGGRREVNSAMTGRVVQVNMQPGERVHSGDCLMIIEAMKMENKITAPMAGLVKSVDVQEGQSVAVNQRLCVLESGEVS